MQNGFENGSNAVHWGVLRMTFMSLSGVSWITSSHFSQRVDVWFEIEVAHYPDTTTQIFWEVNVLRWSTLQPSCTVVIVLYRLVSFWCLNLCFISRICKIFLPNDLSDTQLKMWPILVEEWGLSAKRIKDICKSVNNLFIISLYVKYVYLLFVIHTCHMIWYQLTETSQNGQYVLQRNVVIQSLYSCNVHVASYTLVS